MAALDLGRISLRERERGLIVGGTDSGKSTLAEALMVDFHHRYAHRDGRILLLDSKPRFRGEHRANGRSAKGRYRGWDHGSTVPGSVVVDDPAELDLAWSQSRIVIAQTDDGERGIPMLTACAAAFLRSARARRPQLLVVDETMDFYRANGSAIGGDDVLKRNARAGRERGSGGLYCTQRTKGIPPQLMEEQKKLYLFRIDYAADVTRIWEMGAPRQMSPPTEARVFYFWTKDAYGTVWGPYRLSLPRRAR